MIKVSIYIPLYNQHELIIRALDSVPARDDIEIIVCDDGSTDGSHEAVLEWLSRNPGREISLMRNETNKGPGYTCNRCLDLCKGEYVYEMDSDDYLYTDEWVKALEWLRGADLVYVNGRINSGEVLRQSPEKKMLWCAPWFKFMRREFLGDHRYPEDKLQVDWYLNNDIQALPHSEKYTDLVAYHYNFPRDGSITWQYINGKVDQRWM